jgi:phage N-6-adenine-methyltransferase
MNGKVYSTEIDTWETPDWLFDELNKEFNFTLDPCCLVSSTKCFNYFTPEDDGLKQDWSGETVFCNPPYGKNTTKIWVKKCYEEALKPNTIVVMLVPSRTDTPWFHQYCYKKYEIRFIKGRLKFGSSKQPAPFPSMIVIFDNSISYNNHR